MGYNKFITKTGNTLLDLTDATVEANNLTKDIVAYDKSGNRVIGTLEHRLQEKAATENGVVEADEGFYGLSKVSVNVPKPTGNLEITENGDYDVSEKASVSVNISSDSFTINGIIEEYKVAAGETVNAGDFVEFINQLGGYTLSNSSISNIDACELAVNKVFIAYSSSANSNKGIATILELTESDIIVGNAYNFSSYPVSKVACVTLTENKVLLGYSRYNSSSSRPSATLAIVLTISGNEIIALGAEKEIEEGGNVALVKADATTALLSYASTNGGTVDVGLSINESTITKFNTTGDYYGTYKTKFSRLSDSTAIAATYRYFSPTTYYYFYPVSIGQKSITISSNVYYIEGGGTDYDYAVIRLSDSTFIAIYSDSDTNTNAVLLSVEEGTIVQRHKLTNICDTKIFSEVVGVAVDTNKVIVVGTRSTTDRTGTAVLLTVNNDTITKEDLLTFDTNASSYFKALSLSENKATVFYNNGIGKCITIDSSSGNLEIDNSNMGIRIKPAVSRLHNVGIAKTSGTDGELVEVYCVNNN